LARLVYKAFASIYKNVYKAPPTGFSAFPVDPPRADSCDMSPPAPRPKARLDVGLGRARAPRAGGMVAVALMNLVVALLAAFVAYGRWRLAPYRDLSRPSVLRPAS